MAVSRLTVRKIVVDSASIVQLKKSLEPGHIKSMIDLAITEFSLSVNSKYNLQDNQVSDLVEFIYETYKHDSLEDVFYCLSQAKKGAYGVIYGIDAATFSQWMQLHLENKAREREAINKSGSLQENIQKKQTYEEWLKDQPEWFQNLSREDQKKVIDELKAEWYKKGADYVKRMNEYHKNLKKGRLQFDSAEKEHGYQQFKKQFIQQYWEQKKKSNDKARASAEKQQEQRPIGTANSKNKQS